MIESFIQRASVFSVSDKSFEIFTVGVGHTNKFKLSTIASKPYNKHVFMIDDFNELDRIAEIISEKNLGELFCVKGFTSFKQFNKVPQ